MKNSNLSNFYTYGCLPFKNGYGFGMPILSQENETDLLYSQVWDEVSGRITDIRVVDTERGEVKACRQKSIVRIGDFRLISFLDHSGLVSIGSVNALRDVLSLAKGMNEADSALVLEIDELIGTADQRKSARARMRVVIENTCGEKTAAVFHEGSVLRSVFWNTLIELAGDPGLASRVIKVRGRLKAYLSDDGSIEFDMSALSSDDLQRFDHDQIRSRITSEFDASLSFTKPVAPDKKLFYRTLAEQALSEIKKMSRQEERIAKTLYTVVQDFNVGQQLLEIYDYDKAGFANHALANLRSTFVNWQGSGSQVMQACAFINKELNMAYPLQRGHFLYFLAIHLWSVPQINKLLRYRSERWASSVNLKYADTLKVLSQLREEDYN